MDLQKSLTKKDSFDFIKEIIIKNKQAYIHKPLSGMLKDLPYAPVSFMTGPGTNRYNSYSLTLAFESPTITAQNVLRNNQPLILAVIWETPLANDSIYKAINGNSERTWSSSVKAYFGRQNVKDIILTYDR